LVAKGVDHVAERIRDVAKEEGVAFFESPILARALYFTTEVGAFIPEALYEAVAKVIAYIFNINAINRESGRPSRPELKVPDDLVFDSNGQRSEIFDG
jgi:flagellar biosynthetic protein FlhB